MKHLLKSRIYFVLMLILGTTLLGVTGYMALEGYSFMDALYMTVITLSTTGFMEVQPLSTYGRLFTILLIVLTLSILAYSLGALSSFLLDGDFLVILRKKRVRNLIKRMNNHTIICGYGRNGGKAAEMLTAHRIPFVVIEKNPEVARTLREKNIPVFEENALDDETLKSAGIMKAKALLCTLPDDTDNLYIVLSARAMNKNLTIISRASNDSVEKKLIIAGATEVVKPDTIGGTHMAQMIINPGMREFIDLIAYDSENMFTQISLDTYQGLWGRPLSEIRRHTELDINVVGIKSNDRYIVNPSSSVLMDKSQQLIIMATQDQITKFKERFA